jgi:hypothetical protein
MFSCSVLQSTAACRRCAPPLRTTAAPCATTPTTSVTTTTRTPSWPRPCRTPTATARPSPRSSDMRAAVAPSPVVRPTALLCKVRLCSVCRLCLFIWQFPAWGNAPGFHLRCVPKFSHWCFCFRLNRPVVHYRQGGRAAGAQGQQHHPAAHEGTQATSRRTM